MKAWERAMIFVAKSPLQLKFGGSTEVKHAVDSQVTIILDENAINEALNEVVHPSDPFCTPTKINLYKLEYKKQFDPSSFDYTYRDILEHGFRHRTHPNVSINQIEILRDGLQKQADEKLGSNRNIAVLFNPAVDNFSNKAVPCFNEILVRWESKCQCSVHTTFRSHDLATGWNPNMLAMSEFVNKEIAKPAGCKIKYWVEHNYSLHIYNYDLHIVQGIQIVNRTPSLAAKQEIYNNVAEDDMNAKR